MREAQQVRQELVSRFPQLDSTSRVTRARRLWVEVSYAEFDSVFAYLVKDLKFVTLCTITGFDEAPKLAVTYHIADADGVICNLKTAVDRDQPVLRSIMPVFANAEIYERELVDLLGFKVEGLPEGKRYPLPDSWPEGQYPLRKDWKNELAVPGQGPDEEC
jgi:Ni,Fe-hydrogenase III component G